MRKLINELVEKLFEAEHRRLAGVITELNNRNKKLKGITIDGFLYGGQLYLPPPNVSVTVAGPGQAKQTLHYSLNNEMDAWVRDQKTIANDQDLVRQMLFRLLNKPHLTQREIRNALPECLVALMDNLKILHRTDDEGWTLQGDERAMRQFKKLLPKIEVYSATRLLY